MSTLRRARRSSPIERGTPGAYNIAEPDPYIDIDKARRELGWDPRSGGRPKQPIGTRQPPRPGI